MWRVPRRWGRAKVTTAVGADSDGADGEAVTHSEGLAPASITATTA